MRVNFFFLLLVSLASLVRSDELIVFLLDTSGSMVGQEQAMVDGVNKVLGDMEHTLARLNGTSVRFNVKIWTFSDYSRRLLVETTMSKRPRIALEQYVANGGTPLYDAILQALGTMTDNSTLVIATDGQDTTSQSDRYSVRAAIKKAKQERDIQFIFIGQGEETMTQADNIGLGSYDLGSYAIPVLTGASIGGTIMASPVSASIQTASFRHLVHSDLPLV